MFEQIGKKIKGFTTAFFWITTVLYILFGIISLVLAILYDSFWLFGVLAAIIGPGLAWVSSLTLYGFGELIDKICNIERHLLGSSNEPFVPNGTNVVLSERQKKLEQLHASGLISDDEYRQAIYGR